MRKSIRKLASALIALALPLSLASCSGDDDPAPGPVAVDSVSVAPGTLDLKVGGAAGTLTATVLPDGASDKTVTWTVVSDAGVVSVSSTGATATVTAVANGTATVTAAAANGKKATCVVTVTTPATGVELDRNELTLNPGGSFLLTATVLPDAASDKTVTWSSDHEAIAAVSDGGLVTALAAGAAVITATTADGGFKATCNVTVESLPVRQFLTSVAGHGNSVAIKADGSLWGWGDNGYYNVGDGTYIDRLTPIPIGTDAPDGWTTVSSSGFHTLAIRPDGTLWGWGLNSSDELGLGDNGSVFTKVITRVGTDSDWKMVSINLEHTAALKDDGSLWVWGTNEWGQHGLGDTTRRNVPTQMGADKDWKFVAAGWNYTMAIKNDGSLWGWGMWSGGKIGVPWSGSQINPVPARIGDDNDWAFVSGGYNHSVGIRTDGSLWTWGDNAWAQLGRSIPGQYTHEVGQVGTAKDWKSVAASYNHSVALKADGSVWTWGTNESGQIGDGSVELRSAPVQVAGNDWADVGIGYCCTFGIKADGGLWAWGRNSSGQLGVGDTTDRHTPTLVGNGYRVPTN
jgi:alpha-tubulin suppressor-like RCC1 family protein